MAHGLIRSSYSHFLPGIMASNIPQTIPSSVASTMLLALEIAFSRSLGWTTYKINKTQVIVHVVHFITDLGNSLILYMDSSVDGWKHTHTHTHMKTASNYRTSWPQTVQARLVKTNGHSNSLIIYIVW